MGDADDASEAKTEVAINPCIYHCCKRCARKRRTRYLPQEMFFHILSHLPAQVLHDVMRHVCREWNLMIRNPNFIHHQLRNSTSGIIIQEDWTVSGYGIYVEMRRGCLEICKFECGHGDVVLTSCNGLVLTRKFRDRDIIYVTNPLTKQRATLPPYFHKLWCRTDFRLVFVEASMEYKVVLPLVYGPLGLRTQIAVLTIGVDKVWRHIDIQHLPLTTKEAFWSLPLVTGGYIHWMGKTFVLTLNVETETIREFPMPRLQKKRCKTFLPMGSNLSIVYKPSKSFIRDVWEMNPETGKWIKLLRFNLGDLTCKFKEYFPKYIKSIVPFGWLAVREVLLFSTSDIQRCCVAYNLKTREIQSFELDPMLDEFLFQPHVSSLVWLEGGL